MGPKMSVVDDSITEKAQEGRAHWRIILLLAVVARLVIALVFFEFKPAPPLTEWGFENIAIARSLHDGHGYSSPFFSPSGPTALMAPGYPLFLAGVMTIFGTGSAAATVIILVQELISLLTVAAVMLAARAQFGKRTANLAGFICALAPPMLIAPVKIWDTSLSALLLAGFFWAAASGKLARWKFVPAGAACAVAGLVNPALLPALWAICAWSAWKNKVLPWAGIVAFVLVFLPWPVRNAAVMHAFIPLRTDFGYQLWMGNHPGGDGNFVESMNPMMSAAERTAFVQQGEIAYFREKGVLARTYILSHPSRFLSLTLKRITQFWTGAEAGSGATGVPLLVLAIAGFALLGKRRSTAVLYALPLLIFPMPYYITHVYMRFLYVVDPLMILLAANAVEAFLAYVRPAESPSH